VCAAAVSLLAASASATVFVGRLVQLLLRFCRAKNNFWCSVVVAVAVAVAVHFVRENRRSIIVFVDLLAFVFYKSVCVDVP